MKHKIIVVFEYEKAVSSERELVDSFLADLSATILNRDRIKGWNALGIAYPSSDARMTSGPNDPWIGSVQYRKPD